MGDSIKMNVKEIGYKGVERTITFHKEVRISSNSPAVFSFKQIIISVDTGPIPWSQEQNTHTQQTVHMKYTKYNEEKKQSPA